MKIETVDSPDVTDANAREKTGKTLGDWFLWLDQQGGVGLGRKALVEKVYDATGKDLWWSTTLAVEYERARGQKEKDGRPTGYSICSTKTIAAPLPVVFAAFGDAKTLDRWLGAKTEITFEDGGSLANGDGDAAKIVRLRKDKDLRLAWQGRLGRDTVVDVLFADKGAGKGAGKENGKCGITLNHTRIQSRREADQLRAGWGAALEALKQLLEKDGA